MHVLAAPWPWPVGPAPHRTATRGAMRPGRSDCDCNGNPRDDDRSREHFVKRRLGLEDRRQHHQPGRTLPRSLEQGGGGARGGATMHLWAWMPKARRWVHLEPAGRREVAPGKWVAFKGKRVPSGALGLHGSWQITPPNFHVTHQPPPPPPNAKRPAIVPGHSVHNPGHYTYSPILHKQVWVGASHFQGAQVIARKLPPAVRNAFVEGAKASEKHAQKYAAQHTFWGASGARTSVIPGHWQWEKTKREWQYVEPHTDTTGKPSTVAYRQSEAPPAAFGTRPSYLPPRFFWPDQAGRMIDAWQRTPEGAALNVQIPPHAAFAKAHGLLSSATSQAILGAASAPASRAQLSEVTAFQLRQLNRANAQGRREQAQNALTTLLA